MGGHTCVEREREFILILKNHFKMKDRIAKKIKIQKKKMKNQIY